MKNYSCFKSDILLPDFNKVDGSKWAVIACDQYTSEVEYWKEVENFVGDSPSTLSLMIPEVYLEKTKELVPIINEKMVEYTKNVLIEHKNSLIYTERVQRDGKVKHGIVAAIDLEEYNFKKGSTSLIRATEGTVIERIPPRVEVRKDASIELPHVMLLIDDDKNTVIEPITLKKDKLQKIYDFTLMQGGGSVSGYLIDDSDYESINKALSNLICDENAKRLYGSSAPSKLLFAVGDGNHSLATAKTCYEMVKEKLGDKALEHPARYALVEICNLHDSALEFEPIYRVMFNVDPLHVVKELKNYSSGLKGCEAKQEVLMLSKGFEEKVEILYPEKQLTVGTLQDFIDDYIKKFGGEVDYIHGEDSVKTLSNNDNAIGFIFTGMEKNQLFKTVIFDGALPRKTFSIGHAHDKRYYIECRKIK